MESAEERTKRLKLLAMDCADGRVFTDRHCRSADDVGLVFMPLMLMDDEQQKRLIEKVGQNGVVYEYLTKAGPCSVNNLPSFFSLNVLSDSEGKEFVEYWKEEVDRRKAVVA